MHQTGERCLVLLVLSCITVCCCGHYDAEALLIHAFQAVLLLQVCVLTCMLYLLHICENSLFVCVGKLYATELSVSSVLRFHHNLFWDPTALPECRPSL